MSNQTGFENYSYTFFGPMDMVFSDEVAILDEPLNVKLSMSLLLAIIMAASVVGNLLTISVIVRYRSMRTPTNYYLFSLAVTDFMISLFIPIEIYVLWVPDFYPFGEPGCLIHLVLIYGLCNTSVLTISAFTVERYVVVQKPFLYKKLSNPSRVFKIVVFIWIVSWAMCIPESFKADLFVVKKYVLCYTTVSNEIRILIAFQVIFFFLLPMAMITTLYIMIAVKLKKIDRNIEISSANLKNCRERIVIMLVAVAGSFFFCFSPCFLIRIMMIFPHYIGEDYHMTWRVVSYVCSINGYMITAVNPILYSLMSHKFREAFKLDSDQTSCTISDGRLYCPIYHSHSLFEPITTTRNTRSSGSPTLMLLQILITQDYLSHCGYDYVHKDTDYPTWHYSRDAMYASYSQIIKALLKGLNTVSSKRNCLPTTATCHTTERINVNNGSNKIESYF